jgi:hypothetical protein
MRGVNEERDYETMILAAAAALSLGVGTRGGRAAYAGEGDGSAANTFFRSSSQKLAPI